MTFEEWFTEQYPNADLSESSVIAVKDKMWGAWCAALEWGTRPTTHNSESAPCFFCGVVGGKHKSSCHLRKVAENRDVW